MILIWQILGIITIALLVLVATVYGGYYLYISKFIEGQTKESHDLDFLPKITVVIPTYNEETTIKGKLTNLIEQSYPPNLMEIMLIDSNSEDATVKLARDFMYSHPELNVKIIIENERRGKSEAINKAFSSVDPRSEIIIMTDADARLEKNAIQSIVSNFSDPAIGAVSGTQVLINKEESKETRSEATYGSFYKKLRIGESVIDSSPIFHGELSAYRACVIREEKIREDLNADDSQLANIVRRKGFKAIHDSAALFYEYAAPDKNSKQIQKVRRGQGLSRLFWYNRDMMFKRRYGKFGFIILPANFFMHVVSPFLVFSSLILGFASLFCYLLQGEKLLLLVIVLLALASAVLLTKYFILPGKKILGIAWTFLEYQLILLKGTLLFLGGISLHKWQKVESVRGKYQQESIRLKELIHS